VAVGDVDVGVEPPVERSLGDEVEEREEQLRQDHQSVRRVPHPRRPTHHPCRARRRHDFLLLASVMC
jgi:hypothetical protein